MSGLNLYQCKLCDFTSSSRRAVRLHYVAEHPARLPLLCDYCRQRLDDDFRQHFWATHAQQPVRVSVRARRRRRRFDDDLCMKLNVYADMFSTYCTCSSHASYNFGFDWPWTVATLHMHTHT